MKFGLRDDYAKSFGCFPLQVVTIVTGVASGCLAVYYAWTLVNVSDFSDIRSIARTITVCGMSGAFLISLSVLCFCIPLTARFMFYGTAAAISSALVETVVGWIYIGVLSANQSESKPGPTTNDFVMEGVRTGVVVLLILIFYLFLLGYMKSLVKVLREGGTGWEGLDHTELRERKTEGNVPWRPAYVVNMHRALQNAEDKAYEKMRLRLNLQAQSYLSCSSRTSINSEDVLPAPARPKISTSTPNTATEKRIIEEATTTEKNHIPGNSPAPDSQSARFIPAPLTSQPATSKVPRKAVAASQPLPLAEISTPGQSDNGENQDIIIAADVSLDSSNSVFDSKPQIDTSIAQLDDEEVNSISQIGTTTVSPQSSFLGVEPTEEGIEYNEVIPPVLTSSSPSLLSSSPLLSSSLSASYTRLEPSTPIQRIISIRLRSSDESMDSFV